jgi:hypothetical protein
MVVEEVADGLAYLREIPQVYLADVVEVVQGPQELV